LTSSTVCVGCVGAEELVDHQAGDSRLSAKLIRHQWEPPRFVGRIIVDEQTCADETRMDWLGAPATPCAATRTRIEQKRCRMVGMANPKRW
jgi:hypothetical protein